MPKPPPIPKRRRTVAKLILIGLAIGTLIALGWRVQLTRDVNARLSRIKASGLPTSGTELNNFYSSVPDEQNAAVVITQAFSLMRTYPDGRSNEIANFKIPPRDRSLTAEQKQLLTGYVEMNIAALAKAQEAFALTNNRYPVDYSAGIKVRLPHLAPLRQLTKLATYDALLAAEAGQTSDSCRDIETALRCGKSLESEPDILAQSVRIAALALSVSTLERCMESGSFKGEELVQLAAAFSEAEKTNLMARALVGERAMSVSDFRRIGQERRVGAEPEDEIEVPTMPTLRNRKSLLITGFFERDLAFYLETMQTNIALASMGPPRSLEMSQFLEERTAKARRNLYFVSGLLLSGLQNSVRKEAAGLARLRLAQSAVAIERFRLNKGRLPTELGEVIPRFLPAVPTDPFNGKPERYRRLQKGYVIEFADSDGHNIGGRESSVNWEFTLSKFTVER